MTEQRISELLTELDWTLPAGTVFTQGGEGIAIEFDGTRLTVTHKTDADLARSLVLMKQFGTEKPYTHTEKSCFDTFGIMIDCSRNAVLTPDNLRRVLRLMALMGYNMVQLYTEETYEVDGEPYFGYLRGRYSKAELRAIDEYAASLGIEVIPCIQVLGHLGALMHWSHFHEVRDCDAILLCGEEKTYELIDRMFSSVSSCIKSRRIHIGMDEAHTVGLGKYLDRNGFEDRFEILVKHLTRVCEIAKKYGYHPQMWSDMFFRLANNGDYYLNGKPFDCPERVFEIMPEDIALVYWDYYTRTRKGYDEMFEAHAKFGREIWFAGGAWRWSGFTPHNGKSIELTALAFDSCRRNGIRHASTTTWGDNGAECSLYAVLPTLVATAAFAYGHKSQTYYKRFFRTLTGMRFDDFMVIDQLNKLYPDYDLGWNPSKHLLYNDPLLGQFDKFWSVDFPAMHEKLAAVTPLLARLSRNKKYGHIFRTQKELAEVLQLKCDFGVRARAAYRAGNREECAELALLAKKIIGRIERFYEVFRAQWMLENKPHGFDVQDIRIGGLIQRMKTAYRVLADYGAGTTDVIPELDEEILMYNGFNTNVWRLNATANIL